MWTSVILQAGENCLANDKKASSPRVLVNTTVTNNVVGDPDTTVAPVWPLWRSMITRTIIQPSRISTVSTSSRRKGLFVDLTIDDRAD